MGGYAGISIVGFTEVTRIHIIGKRVIWGYPHIKRIFTLKNGMKRNLDPGQVYAEEKIDGFNVRIAFIGKNIYAFSRGGFLDSFVTEKAREMTERARELGPNPYRMHLQQGSGKDKE